MQIISKRIRSSIGLLVFIGTAIALPADAADAADLVLSPSQEERITLNIRGKHVLAKDRKKNIGYDVAASVSQQLIRAEDIRLISNPNSQKTRFSILLVRQTSRPGAMGRGYCGAGYEDYLLLVEIFERKLLLRDRFLLQSCLKNISMFIDQGEDHPANGIMHESDGAFSYRLVDDDSNKHRRLSVTQGRFQINLVTSSGQ